MIGIIGAMEEEVKALADMMSGVETATVAGMVFKKGQFKGKDVVVVRSGIGKVNAAVCTQILADRYNVDCVINTGVAGSLKNEINIGDIVRIDAHTEEPPRGSLAAGECKRLPEQAEFGGLPHPGAVGRAVQQRGESPDGDPEQERGR